MPSLVTILCVTAVILVSPFVLVSLHRLLTLIWKDRHMATITDAATAIETAATSLNTAASALTTAVTAISGLNNTTALDQPLADLATAVTAVQTAATAVEAAANPAPAA